MNRIAILKPFIFLLCSLFFTALYAQSNTDQNKFKQLGTELPTPNNYRTASGAPGHEYWQQQADYVMDIRLDDEKQTIHGEETITYHNNSPDALSYLWLQMDQNLRNKDSDTYSTMTGKFENTQQIRLLQMEEDRFDGGFNIISITDRNGDPMKYTINKTMMRIDLDEILQPKQKISFTIKWWYNINNRDTDPGRSGYEYFEGEDNYIYTIAQFYPRMVKYSDVDGWQHRQFLGGSEFTLEFGDFDVKITVPDDHLVAATGELQNPDEVLSKTQRQRLETARTSFDEPYIIFSQEEASIVEKSKSSTYKTWHFKAESVRDFAFANSRKFIWDAMAVKFENGHVAMAMSLYPKEGNPLWERYSTRVAAHTLKWYSHYSFPYPYPVNWTINSKDIAMEYPMISFNYGRTNADGSYSEYLKNRLIGVIIHEVGHNFFPMVVNSDERQLTWLDEGINAFLEFLTEKHWDPNFPSRRGPTEKALAYMSSDKSKQVPMMADAESILQLGNNSYLKPATALNILRHTIMGEELFDHAFKTYAERWKFKYASAADFFRTMEDASGVDLDWFWRGWFYTTDHVDISIDDVRYFNSESLSDLAIEAVGDDKHFYEITFSNIGGLISPLVIQFNYQDGSSEIKNVPAEIWRKNNDRITKVFPTDRRVKSFVLDPNGEIADTDDSNNSFEMK